VTGGGAGGAGGVGLGVGFGVGLGVVVTLGVALVVVARVGVVRGTAETVRVSDGALDGVPEVVAVVAVVAEEDVEDVVVGERSASTGGFTGGVASSWPHPAARPTTASIPASLTANAPARRGTTRARTTTPPNDDFVGRYTGAGEMSVGETAPRPEPAGDRPPADVGWTTR
jgi:hypothetical protein